MSTAAALCCLVAIVAVIVGAFIMSERAAK